MIDASEYEELMKVDAPLFDAIGDIYPNGSRLIRINARGADWIDRYRRAKADLHLTEILSED